MVNIQEIISFLETYFPKKLSYDWDNTGLNVGVTNKEIENILICVDLTTDIVEEAIQNNCQMIISHHPLIFQGIKRITNDTVEGRVIIDLLKNNISHYCIHTNADISKYGINNFIAEKLELNDIEGLSYFSKDQYYKLAVYIPLEHVEAVKKAIANEGGGHVGKYSYCFFNTRGEGNFMPLEGTKPYIGDVGKIERVDEVKIETIVSQDKLNRVIKAMLKSHPYEEVAYDIYKLENDISSQYLGLIGKREIDADSLVTEVKRIFNCAYVKGMILKENFKKIAICSGSGKELVKDAYYKGADVFISGDITHHSMILARELNLSIIDIGHFWSEKLFIDLIYELLLKHKKKDQFKIIKSEIITDYFKIF